MFPINPDLINDLAQKRAAIFIGAGVSAGVTTKSGTQIKTWGRFLTDATQEIFDPQTKEHAISLIDQKDYLMACEMISRSLGSEEWRKILQTEYKQRAAPSELQKIIMQLKQRIILTTNFDLYLEAAWEEANKDATHYPEIIKTIDKDSFRAFRDSQEYIFKIHGSIDEMDTMIFTKKEYSDKAYGNWAYSKLIETILMTHTVIFIGFSLSDPAVSQIIETYARNIPSARPHYIFLPGEYPEKFIEINKELRKIFIIPYDKSNNHHQLTEIFKSLLEQVERRRREITIESMRLEQQTK